jgi:hypothetical protein
LLLPVNTPQCKVCWAKYFVSNQYGRVVIIEFYCRAVFFLVTNKNASALQIFEVLYKKKIIQDDSYQQSGITN